MKPSLRSPGSAEGKAEAVVAAVDSAVAEVAKGTAFKL
jgi:hypothetical protein